MGQLIQPKKTCIPENPEFLFRHAMGLRIKAFRKNIRKTQGWLATQTGLNFRSISDIENGKRSVRTYELLSFAKALQVSCEKLLRDSNEQV